MSLTRKQVPEILLWAGVLTMIFGVVNWFLIPEDRLGQLAINAVVGPLLILFSWVIRRDGLPGRVVPWLWAMSATLLVVVLVRAFWLQPNPANLAYIAVVMTAFGPLTHGWPPFIAASVAMLSTAWIGFALASWPGGYGDLMVCVAAVLVGGLLLRLRLGAIDAIADSNARLERQALLDGMSDTFNRAGLARSVPGLLASAERSGDDVLAWFIDVRGLKEANDRFGHPFGDEIILAVVHALRSCIRTNDLLARWGGDEFVVLGTGREGSAEDLNARVDAALMVGHDVDLDWHPRVTVGFASGPADSDVNALISLADADMYRRRGLAGAPDRTS